MKKFNADRVNEFGHGVMVLPAILEPSVEDVQMRVNQVIGKVRRVQVDIIDGIFADNLTVSVLGLEQVDFGDIVIDLQLMTEYPSEYLGDCFNAGVRRVFGHIEKMHSQEEFVEVAKELKLIPGLAVDLYTPIEELDRSLLKDLDGVLLMSVKAGFSGQDFGEEVLPKISKLREWGYEGDIQIDGGMNKETIKRCFDRGANQFAEGSFLWKADNIDEALDYLRNLDDN